MKSLSSLKPGEKGQIESIHTDEGMKRRLWDLGFTKGTMVECVQASPMGDPVAYRVRGTMIAIRKIDADYIKLLETITPTLGE